MKRIYITGVSGTGKSTISKELSKRGVASFDIDSVPGLCEWQNKETSARAEFSTGVGGDWLSAHEWICNKEKLGEILDQHQDTTVVVGVAHNQDEYLDLFDKFFILECSEKVLRNRLSTRTDNDFGKHEAEQNVVAGAYKWFVSKSLKQGAIPVNTEGDINVIVGQIISQL